MKIDKHLFIDKHLLTFLSQFRKKERCIALEVSIPESWQQPAL